jgi:hypothetical protein
MAIGISRYHRGGDDDVIGDMYGHPGPRRRWPTVRATAAISAAAERAQELAYLPVFGCLVHWHTFAMALVASGRHCSVSCRVLRSGRSFMDAPVSDLPVDMN